MPDEAAAFASFPALLETVFYCLSIATCRLSAAPAAVVSRARETIRSQHFGGEATFVTRDV